MLDLPIFAVVYVLFLFAFAHIHYIVSNTLHTGVEVRRQRSGRRSRIMARMSRVYACAEWLPAPSPLPLLPSLCA